jgi:membrane fusion protein, multidrug efflux system
MQVELRARIARARIGAACGCAAAAALLLLTAAWASGLLSGPAQAQERRASAPPPAIVAEARTETLADRVEALGTTRGSESVEITSDVVEKVVEIRFEDGQVVSAGDVLVVLDKTEEEADLRAAEALLEEARVAFGRIERLTSRDVAALAERDARQAALRTAEAQVAVAGARIQARMIRAPFDGVVGLREVSLGALVRPGDVITTLDMLDPIRVDFTVPSTHLDALRPGLPVEARVQALAGRAFEGEILSVGTRVDPVTRSVPVRAAVANPGPPHLLRPGLLMSVFIDKEPREAVVVPEEAIVPRGAETFVLVVGEGDVVARRPVRTGLRRPGTVEITSGLTAGERVITHGVDTARPGEPVRVRATQAPGQPLAELLAADGSS